MKKKLRVLHDSILVKTNNKKEEKTKSGIVIPIDTIDSGYFAEVILVGPGRIFSNGMREKMEIKVGDVIRVERYDGVEIDLDGEKYKLIKEREVDAIYDL